MSEAVVIEGIRLGALIGRRSRGAVHEGTQLSLDRSVALRLLGPGDFDGPADEERFASEQRIAASLHHPGILPIYEGGEWEGGRFVASRLMTGGTLEQALARGSIPSGRADSIARLLEAALASVHSAGLVHGRIAAHNILLDGAGNAVLSDLGLARPGSAADDRADLAEVIAMLRRSRPRRRRTAVLAGCCGVLAIGAFAAVASLGSVEGNPEEASPPSVAAASDPLGSGLAPGGSTAVGCASEPDPNTPSCVLSQRTLGGGSSRVREDGLIRRWAVRGADGELTLQVIGHRGGRAFLRSFSQAESVDGPGPAAFDASLRVERGDLVGVVLGPGATIGSREGDRSAEFLRWQGTIPYRPERVASEVVGGELLLRADVEVGVRQSLPQLTGRDAASAERAESLGHVAVLGPGGEHFEIVLGRFDDEIVLDSRRAGRRVARASVPDAASDGRLLSLQSECGFRHGFCLRWYDSSAGSTLVHAYRLTPGGTFRQIG